MTTDQRDKARDQRAIDSLLRYIHIDTSHPKPLYEEAIKFLNDYLGEITSLSVSTCRLRSGLPYIYARWLGQKENSIVLNSHMDVVAFNPQQWKEGKPTGSLKEGRIFGRGSQDMKSVGIQQVEAVRRLIDQGFKPKRSVVMLFVPDEEVGGAEGWKYLADGEFLSQIRADLVLDESMPSPGANYLLTAEERCPFWVDFTFHGQGGHGSTLTLPTHASQHFRQVLNRLSELNASVSLHDVSIHNVGDMMTANLTRVTGGIQTNVIPKNIHATFDIRVPSCKVSDFHIMINEFKKIPNISISFDENPQLSKVDSSLKKKWLDCITNCFKQNNLEVTLVTMPGTTDMRYVRHLGVPAFGLTLLNHTPMRLHDADEYVDTDVFIEGIDVYEMLLKKLLSES